MNKVLQKAYFRQRVVKEVLGGRSQAEVARRHKISRMSVYRWMQRYDGSVESLKERSRRPQSHPNAHHKDEYSLIKRVCGANKGLGLVCLHLVLEGRHGYKRSVSGLYRALKRLGIGRKRQRKKRYKAQPYDTPKIAGERVQIDVKYVPKACHAPGLTQMYQYTAVDECTRLRFRYIFEEKSSLNAAKFLMMAQNYYPFEIRSVQTDNGSEFTNALFGSDKLSAFERYCKKTGIAHKRIRVATPRHNGKVERVHRIDQERFYDVRSFYSVEDANTQLKRYQRMDNRFPLIVLGRKSPLQYYKDLSANV
jgi:Transposase and inactivated derivatives